MNIMVDMSVGWGEGSGMLMRKHMVDLVTDLVVINTGLLVSKFVLLTCYVLHRYSEMSCIDLKTLARKPEEIVEGHQATT